MQYQSNILKTKILLPFCLETTALGAAYLAGLCTGFWKNLEEIKNVHRYQKEYFPTFDNKTIKEIDRKRRNAIKATRIFK